MSCLYLPTQINTIRWVCSFLSINMDDCDSHELYTSICTAQCSTEAKGRTKAKGITWETKEGYPLHGFSASGIASIKQTCRMHRKLPTPR